MPRSSKTALQPVRPVAAPPSIQPQTAGLGSIVTQGLAWGVGQSIAHHAVGSLFSTPRPVAPTCQEYQRCLTKVDKETCDTLYEQCARS